MSIEDDRKLIKRIDTYGEHLTPYEAEVIESFTLWLEGGRPLTEKQRTLAEQIDERRVK